MWNCRSKLKLHQRRVFRRADDNSPRVFVLDSAFEILAAWRGLTVGVRRFVRADFVNAERRAEDCPPYQIDRSLQSFQLALDLFRLVKMLLNNFCCIIRKLLHVGIAPAGCFLFEFSQVFFVVLDHHVHVVLV